MSTLQSIAEAFELGGNVIDVHPYGRGLINDTYLVTTDAQTHHKVILQRINARVFPEPARIMANLPGRSSRKWLSDTLNATAIRTVRRCN